MPLARRELLTRTGLALVAGAIASSGGSTGAVAQSLPALPPTPGNFDDWNAVRAQFALSDDFIHMSAMLISSHPKPVREAIDEHRRGMDANPITYLNRNNHQLQEAARTAAGQYLGVNGSEIALTDSTRSEEHT